MKTISAILSTLLFTGLVVVNCANTAVAKGTHSIESLERERAALIKVIVDESIEPEARQKQIRAYFRRLTDIERMVLRDDRLLGNDDAMVKRAFNHYDLTFMVHASVEAKRDITDHWLSQLGLSTNSIMSTQARRR